MNYCLGSSTLDVPFAFPDGKVAKIMNQLGVPASGGRAEQLLVIYWDGIEAGDINSLPPAPTASQRRVVAVFMESQGVNLAEASAFIEGMKQIDPLWSSPNWGLWHTATRGGTGLPFGLPSLTKILVIGGLGFFAYGLLKSSATTFITTKFAK